MERVGVLLIPNVILYVLPKWLMPFADGTAMETTTVHVVEELAFLVQRLVQPYPAHFVNLRGRLDIVTVVLEGHLVLMHKRL